MEEGPICCASFFLFSSIPRKKCLYVNKALKNPLYSHKGTFIGSIQVKITASSCWPLRWSGTRWLPPAPQLSASPGLPRIPGAPL